jgi:hypothetical protein
MANYTFNETDYTLDDGTYTFNQPIETLDVTVTASGEDYDINTSSFTTYVAQGVTVSKSGVVSKVSVNTKTASTSYTNTYYISIYDDSGGSPNTRISDETEISISDWGEDYSWNEYTINNCDSISSTDKIHVVIRGSGDYVSTRWNASSSNPYAGGNISYDSDAASWGADAGWDCGTKVYIYG